MRALFLTIPAIGAVAAYLLGAGGVAAEPPDSPAALFQESCAACHAIPDPTLPMDLAWLDQVERTT